jgi:L-ascorbate metabolism protein UlaG (beta-lactamase superfamily)
MTPCRITLVGAATTLLELGSFRLVTDPVFDPEGGRYTLRVLGGVPIGMRKTTGPAIPPEALGRVDAVLLSHDQHQDNLDDSGRRLVASVARTLTTPAAARRLGGSALGLAPWESTELVGDDGARLRITATPARHGPPGSQFLVGAVTGFFLEWDGQRNGGLYISGDTVRFRGLREVGARLRVHTAVLHVGGAQFGLSGPVRYTMRARHVAAVARDVGAREVIPIHYEGWRHFREAESDARAALESAALPCPLRWIARGQTLDLAL